MTAVDEVGAEPSGEDAPAPVAAASAAAPASAASAAAPVEEAGGVSRLVLWLAAAAALAVAAAGLAVAALADGQAAPALGPGEVTVQMDVEHSLFETEALRVVEGTRVRFVVVNGDPIAHELIVGPPDVHARHAGGSEAEHPSIPGEVSVGPNGTAVTTFRFDEVGTFEFACHLPGHYEHGMHGEVEVVAADG